MTYDEDLADRMRASLSDRKDVSERKMFGGIAFMVAGNMTVCASGQGGMMVRVGTDKAEALLSKSGTEQVEMQGRPMKGWLRVSADRLDTNRQLAAWVNRGLVFVDTLPPKT